MRRVESMRVERVRRRGRPKKTWGGKLQGEMTTLDLSKNMTSDRNMHVDA